jgi:hypothetical protein
MFHSLLMYSSIFALLAMRSFKRTKNWVPQPDTEAPEKGLGIAQEGAQSRV